jgi:hypothetical protein
MRFLIFGRSFSVKKTKLRPETFFKFALSLVDKTNFSDLCKLGLVRAMMEMRVMVEMMNLSCEELHRFLYSSHIVKTFASGIKK